MSIKIPLSSHGVQPCKLPEIILALTLTCVPLIIWLISTGDVFLYLSHKVPAGQTHYIFSKLCGLYAYYFLAIQLILGFQGKHSSYFKYHRTLGILTTLMIGAHVYLFITAAYLRSHHLNLEILIPTFDNGYYKTSISIGVISAYLVLAVIAAGFLQNNFAFLKWAHRLAPVVDLLGWLHSINIGTETRSIATIGFYLFFFCLVLYAFIKKHVSLSR